MNKAVEKICEIWKQTADTRAAQLVFCDLSTPSHFRGRFSVYDDIKKKLAARGIPENEIAFIQDYDTDAQKLTLFKEVRSGRVRVLMGSTQKMGTGTNVQERLIALHHLDAPWRPADVEQREGRILRQGNQHSAIQIYRYVTEGSFDAYMWQTLETKAKFINQIMTGDTHVRRIEDIDSRALTYAEVKAIASGNPLVIEKASIDAEIARFTRLRSQHAEAQYRIRSTVRRLGEEIPVISQRLENVKLDIAGRKETHGDAFEIRIANNTFKDRVQAGDALNRLAAQLASRGCEKEIGEFAGFRLLLRCAFLEHVEILLKGKNTYSANISETGVGTIRSMEYTLQNLDECQERYVRELADSEKRKRELESKIGQPFEHEEKLQSLTLRQQEIVKSLDLTKNQAANNMDSANPASEDEAVSQAASVNHTEPRTRRPAAIRV